MGAKLGPEGNCPAVKGNLEPGSGSSCDEWSVLSFGRSVRHPHPRGVFISPPSPGLLAASVFPNSQCSRFSPPNQCGFGRTVGDDEDEPDKKKKRTPKTREPRPEDPIKKALQESKKAFKKLQNQIEKAQKQSVWA